MENPFVETRRLRRPDYRPNYHRLWPSTQKGEQPIFTGETAFQAQMHVPSGSPNTAGWEVEVEFESQAGGGTGKVKHWIPAATIQGLKKFPLPPGKWRVHSRVGKPQEGPWSEWVDFEVRTGDLAAPLKAPEFKPIQIKPSLPPGRVLPK